MKIGSIIDGKWEVVDMNERGGQGQVYKVRCIEAPDFIYALKFLNKQSDIERRTRMHKEVCNVSNLSNEHLMKVIYSNVDRYQEVSEKLYYVSPFIEGGTLEEYVGNNNVSFSIALSFFSSFLQVISYCHKNAIIHRDIKPDNILLCDGLIERFVLIDFGLSFNLKDDDGMTPTNQQLGNRFLLLPELVSGTTEQKRLVESDLSQGCAVFFYTLTGIIPNSLLDGEGKMPHRRHGIEAFIRKKIEDEIMYTNIMTIFDRAFSNNVDERYHSADDIIRDIQTIDEYRVNSLGGNIMTNEIISIEKTAGTEVYRYSELMRQLNPSTEICNPAGLTLPRITNVSELVEYGVALPAPVKEKVSKYYLEGDYVTAASTTWLRAIGLLKKRILSLGEEFVADMVETDDLEYVRNLPAYRVIELAHDLGFIDKAGKRKLQMANDYYNYFNNDEADEYEEMPQDEANIIIKNSISYILYNNDESFGLQFNDFREKLKTGRVTDLFEDDKVMFGTCPYFYLKTSVRSLLKLFGETDGIEYDNVTANMNIMFPAIWERLKLEERRALADAYTDYTNINDYKRTAALNTIMLQVHGFDYVMENVRSRTYIQVAQKLIDVHFGINNFYNEPGVIKKLEDLGTVIPRLALKECMTAVLYVKLGNRYGTSWSAEQIADRILDRLTLDEWVTYLEKYMVEESNLLDGIKDSNKMRNQWKEVIKKYKLSELNIVEPQAKRLVSIA